MKKKRIRKQTLLQGWGAVWRVDDVEHGDVSDPYLMTGFDKKVLHVIKHNQNDSIEITIQVDVTGAAGNCFVSYYSF